MASLGDLPPCKPAQSWSSSMHGKATAGAGCGSAQKREGTMLQDFMKFDQYLTPMIIRVFYFLLLLLIVLSGLVSLVSALAMMSSSVLVGLFSIIGTLIFMAAAIIGARVLTEIIMVLFQNNEHLAAIRARAEGH
jgi:hypothetical protein